MSYITLGEEGLSKKLIEENCKLIVVVLKDFTVIKYKTASEIKDFGVLGYAFGKKDKDVIEIFWTKNGEVYNVLRKLNVSNNFFLHQEIALGKKVSEVI